MIIEKYSNLDKKSIFLIYEDEKFITFKDKNNNPLLLTGQIASFLVPGVVFLMQKILLKTKIIKNSIYGKWRTLKFSNLSWIFPMFFLFRNTIPTIRNFNNFNEKFKSHITDSKKFKEYFIDKKSNEVKNEEKKEVRLKFVFYGSGPQSLCLFRHFLDYRVIEKALLKFSMSLVV
jgi:hypothetical protein